jgi:hypothetical protein
LFFGYGFDIVRETSVRLGGRFGHAPDQWYSPLDPEVGFAIGAPRADAIHQQRRRPVIARPSG